MDQRISESLFALLRTQILGIGALGDEQKAEITENAAVLLGLSRAHDVAHLVGFSLFEAGLSTVYPAFERDHMMAVFRHEGLAFELSQIRETLEKAEIPFIPLKGALIRDLYPEPWMRTSCDVDVLVRQEDARKAADRLCESLGYRIEEETRHDLSLFSEGGVHVELHFSLINEEDHHAGDALLARAWEFAAPTDGKQFEHALSDPFFYTYHVAHMARHFAAGGCGIRSFLDLWLLDTQECDRAARSSLINEAALSAFLHAAQALCRHWFMGEENTDPHLLTVERFVLFGGAYGSKHNYVTLQQKKRGGRLGYVLSRLFIPYKQMKYIYPILKKAPVLLPVFWVWRWIEHLLHGGAKRSANELRRNQTLSAEERDSVDRMMRELEL